MSKGRRNGLFVELPRISQLNLSSQEHPVAAKEAGAPVRRVGYRKAIGSKLKLLRWRCGTRGIAVSETSLPFRSPHPKVSGSKQGTIPRDALLQIGDLTIRRTRFLCQSRSSSGSGLVSDNPSQNKRALTTCPPNESGVEDYFRFVDDPEAIAQCLQLIYCV